MWWQKPKLNKLQTLWLRLTNKSAFATYQHEQSTQHYFENFLHGIDEFNQKYPQFFTPKENQSPSFKHSGQCGDLIYALPIIKAIADKIPAKLYLKLNVKSSNALYKHHLNDKMLDENTFTKLKPLIESQPYINSVHVFKDQPIGYDLDLFRELPILPDRSQISRWYFYAFGHYADLTQPWLNVIPNKDFADKIIIARSFRYTNPAIHYSFLKKYSNLLFVGLEGEYKELLSQIPTLKYQKVENFLELAQIIAGAKGFIGNQSFPYALAEALKVPRILELCPICPNTLPYGPNAYDVLFQPHFEKFATMLIEKSK